MIRILGWMTIALVVPSGVAGCCSGVLCDVCASPGIGVIVIDAATQGPIMDAIVTANGKACPLGGSAGPGGYSCDVSPGTYTIDVSAPGHTASQVKVTLEDQQGDGCCSCPPSAVTKVSLAMM